MVCQKLLIAAAVLGVACASPSALDLAGEVYRGCLQHFSVSCVKPKALAWFSEVVDKPAIKITEELVIVKKHDPEQVVVRIQCKALRGFDVSSRFSGATWNSL